MANMNAGEKLSFLLVVIGGLNWGLVGFFKFDLVAELFGEESGLSRVIYSLVGLATVYLLVAVLSKKSANA